MDAMADAGAVTGFEQLFENSTSWGRDRPHKPAKHLMWMFVAISVIGILGNSFSIVLVAKKRRSNAKILSDIYRVYVIALAVADNGMLFFTGILRYVVIAWFYKPVEAGWWYEIHVCRWHRFFMHTFHNASVWLLVVMAFDRFLAVCCPFAYREMKHQPNNAIKVVVGAFMLSLAFATPFLAVGPLYKSESLEVLKKYVDDMAVICPRKEKLCLLNSDNLAVEKPATLVSAYDCQHAESNVIERLISPHIHVINGTRLIHTGLDNTTIKLVVGCSLEAFMSEQNAYTINVIFHIILAFLLPYFVLIILNAVIFWKLNCRKMDSVSSAEGRQRLNRRITVMMLAVCGTFILLWLPQVLTLLSHVDAHAHNCDKDSYYSSLAALSGITNSALNFILYCLTVAKFRREAALTLHLNCLFPKEKPFVRSRIASGGGRLTTWRQTHRRETSLGRKPTNNETPGKRVYADLLNEPQAKL